MTDIVVAAGSFWPREGGAERQMRQVLALAAARGLDVAVLTQVLEQQPRTAQVDGIRVVRLGSVRLFRKFPRLAQIHFTFSVAARLLRERPKAVVTIQLGTASTSAAMARPFARFRHVVRLTGGGTAQHRSEPFARQASPLGRLLVRLVARAGVTVVAPAQHLLRDFSDAFPRSRAATRLMPNGIVPPAVDQILPFGDREGVVWYSRRGAAQSRETFLAVAKEASELPFLVIGHSDLVSSPGIESVGWVADPYAVLGRARVLLNTSPTEGMPNMVLQALGAGMRVVGPPNEGLLELSRVYPHALSIVDLDSPGQAANALRAAHAAPPPAPVALVTSDQVIADWITLLTEEP